MGISRVTLATLCTKALGYRVNVRVWEAGAADTPSVVLVHGVVVSSRYMGPLGSELEPWARVYAPDLPGHGLSEKPRRPLDALRLSEALAEVLAGLSAERPILLGNSFGCQIVAELAASRPDLPSACVLVSPTYDPAATRLQQVVRWLRNMSKEPPSLGRTLLRDYVDARPHRALAMVARSLQHRIEDRLPLVRAPTLVVCGDRDPIVPSRWAEEATRLLPNGELCVVREAAHTLNFSHPRELAGLVREFVGEG